jgi:hypothetical protein
MFRARDAILALPAVQPRVKPLVWSDFKEGGCVGKPYPFQFFITQAFSNGKYLCHHDTSWHNDLAAAKAHAQAAYQTAALEPAVQPDAAAIREAALVKALDAAFPIVRKASVVAKMDAVNASPSDPTALQRKAWMRECYAALELVVSARALIDSPRKEVMPLDAGTTETQTQAHDIGPGDQAVAGAADYPALREAIHKMVGLYETGDRSTYSACPQSAVSAIAFLDDYEARNCPAPKLLVDDCDIALTWEVGGWKLYQYCVEACEESEMTHSFHWTGQPTET